MTRATDRWLSASLLAALAALLFANTLDGGFVIDDRSFVVENASVLGDAPVFSSPTPPTVRARDGREIDAAFLGLYRPLTVLTYRLTYQRFGLDPFWYHAGNVLLHALSTALLVLAASRIATRSRTVPVLAGILFACHPIHVEAVAWVVGRAEILACTFAALAVLCHGEPERRAPWRRPVAGAALYALASLSKESALPVPLLLFAIDRTSGASLALAIRRAVPYAVVAAGIVALRIAVLGRFGPDVSGDPFLASLGPGDRLLLGLSVLGKAAQSLLLPFDLAIYHPPASISSPSARALGALALASIAFALFRLRRAQDLWIGIAWFSISMLPFVHLVPIGATYADRFLYLPSAGAAIAAAAAIERSPKRARAWLRALALLLAAIWAGITLARNATFENERTLWEEVLERHPDCALAAFQIGLAFDRAGILEYESEARRGALHYYEQSLTLDPRHEFAVHAHLRLGDYAAGRLGDAARALDHYRAALALDPRDCRVLLAIARLLPSGLVTREEALELAEQAFRLAPDDAVRREAEGLRDQIRAYDGGR